jgi:NADH-quinone oxidoreductase subunit J
MQEPSIAVMVTCALALVSGLFVVLPRRPVHCAMALLAHSLALAGLYVALDAEFVGMTQVIVYSGAIVVLFLFVVLLFPKGGRAVRLGPRRRLSALLGGGLFLTALLSALLVEPTPAPAAPAAPAVSDVGRALFSSLLVPFELTAPLLLVAVIGAVTLWQRQEAKGP